ncbi:vitamin B12 dependent-methionine synthase activation domain-containing protein [Microbacter margulisiae]|uniref:Cobalamin-dependent methionine synthase I n=1 Tax=Microbacter margulisiae TaxID=1350067 RepID=A0A7W5DQS6_9PORP|nr:vitamin B12 dependent-methionine synthase activation domain-containing protein [Microbacter margulisiae]MBB3187013.1 cobalamin-dependent methionine synthase I [Microbacter margulisiae]
MQHSQFHSYRFTFQEVSPTLDDIFSVLRLDQEEEDHPATVFVNEIFPKLHGNKDIIGGYNILPVNKIQIREGMIEIAGTNLHLERQICSYMKGATSAALFLCTAGNIFTKLANQLTNKGDLLEAYIVDVIGSLTVENAMDKIQDILSSEASLENLNISNRYSPGYCNWHLASQETLFHLIGTNPTGISLSESCLMQPIKSVSGIIAIGAEVKKRAYGCPVCKNQSCIYRNIQRHEERA